MSLHDLILAIARALQDSAVHAFNGQCDAQVLAGLTADWQARLQGQQSGLLLSAPGANVLGVSDPAGRYRLYLIVGDGSPQTEGK